MKPPPDQDPPAAAPGAVMTGTLRVTVTDGSGRPQNGASVHIMRRHGNTRDEGEANTGPDGVAEFKKLVRGYGWAAAASTSSPRSC